MWYKTAKLEDKIKKLVKRFPGNGIKLWILDKPKEVYVSFGDWADDVGRFLKELKIAVGGGYKIRHDFETLKPDSRKWKKISSYIQPDSWGYWMDQNGRLYPCKATHGHQDVLKQIGIKSYNEAFQKGYIRLVAENRELFVNTDGRKLSNLQIRTLNYMSKNYDFIKFVTDFGDGYNEFEDQKKFNEHLRSIQ